MSSPYHPPPHGLRLLSLPDRLVLHDITYALRSDPSDRNALIDAANSVHHRHNPPATNTLVDLHLPTPPSQAPSPVSRPAANRFLVIPFAPPSNPHSYPAPYQTASPDEAAINASDSPSYQLEAAAAFLGLLPLHSDVFAVLATQVRHAASHPSGPIFSIAKVRLLPLSQALPSKEQKEAAAPIIKLLESGSLYYSLATDITCPSQHRHPSSFPSIFYWNHPLASRLPQNLQPWTIRAVYGFAATNIMPFHLASLSPPTTQFNITLISRRSRLRAGTRYITRGVDAMGSVANFVETEQLVWSQPNPHAYTSFLIIRGSIPVFWRQNNGIAKPSPQLDGTLTASRRAFALHFNALHDAYAFVSAVSLVDKHGSEAVLADAFERHFDLFLNSQPPASPPKLVAFDFHNHCGGKDYERGLSLLMDSLRQDIAKFAFFSPSTTNPQSQILQQGVFRINCVDCLDRTNVVQSMVARVALTMQLKHLFAGEMPHTSVRATLPLFPESEDRYKHLWGDNADAVSKQYSGTGALKTDFTRTGKRSTTGVIGDGVKSVMRMYYKNFVDEGRQEVIDILCGNVVFRQSIDQRPHPLQLPLSDPALLDTRKSPSELDKRSSTSSSLWYAFDAHRVNAGGDKQQVVLQLYDKLMYIVTSDGICLEFPRNALSSWSKPDDGKISEKKVVPARLRLIFAPSLLKPATTSPLDLVFKAGNTARENFLRALVSWAQPDVVQLLGKKDLRVRVIASLRSGPLQSEDWGLAHTLQQSSLSEVVALVLPEAKENSRQWGLAAVPLDIDSTDYVLVGATSVDAPGPALAVLVSKRIAPSVMLVSDATTHRPTSSGIEGAAAISLQVCGTTLCFVSAKLKGRADLEAALRTLKLGRVTFDVSNQYHHFYAAGLLGDVKWTATNRSPRETGSENWFRLPDGSSCYSLENGLSIMRREFPTLKNDERVSSHNSEGDATPSPSQTAKKCITLADAIVEGRSAPQLSKDLVQCSVRISELRAEELLMPRGVEQVSQMNTVVVLYSDLATADGVASRQVQRPSKYPEWRDPLNVVMIPSKVEEIQDSFLVGQIVIPTPLGDPIPAGHFVIPVSYASMSNGEFDIPCRLAGKQTGRVLGRIEIREGEEDTISTYDSTAATPSRQNTAGLRSDGRSSLPPVPASSAIYSGVAFSGDALHSRPHSTALPRSDGYPSAPKKKGAMDEVNEKLNFARKKGSKQMKSVVNRLSSFLNQSSTASSNLSGASTIPSLEAGNQWKGSGLGTEGIVNNNDGGKPEFDSSSVRREQLAPRDNTSANKPVMRRSSSQNPFDDFTTSGDTKVEHRQHLEKLELQKVASKASPAMANVLAVNNSSTASPAIEDSLLKGLRDTRLTSGSEVSGKRMPKHVNENGFDSLLSGLARQKAQAHTAPNTKGNGGDDEDWGDFEGAAASGAFANSNSNVTKSGSGSSGGPSLLDF